MGEEKRRIRSRRERKGNMFLDKSHGNNPKPQAKPRSPNQASNPTKTCRLGATLENSRPIASYLTEQ
jgi:hypothetical protein